MQDLSEYSGSTSLYELFNFFYEHIISGEIRSFSSFKNFAQPILENKRCHPVVMQAFSLIKRLYWGFFSAINQSTHQKLWDELVIKDKDFPRAGDLKRTLQISNLYIGMLDIHGYTKFCMDSRKNLSMMHTLDHSIEYDIGRIANACGAVSQRERGDEIVVVATTATDILTATLAIIDFFNKTNVVKDSGISTERIGDATALPNFKVTAGITGGNTTSPLIITEKGNLAGFLLNSGARLQMRANELSPTESRVMIAKQVQMNFIRENASIQGVLAEGNAIFFFDTGHIEFKGVMIPTCEVVFTGREWYKKEFAEEMNRLFGSIKENLWEQRIYTDLVELIAQTAMVMPKFQITPPVPIDGIKMFTNDSLMHLSDKAYQAYVGEDYILAVSLLHRFIEILEQIPFFERLVLDYLKGISAQYTMLLDSYVQNIDGQVDANALAIFQDKNYHAWIASKKGAEIYEKLRDMGRGSSHITKKKSLWYSLIKQKQSEMVFNLYSGKK